MDTKPATPAAEQTQERPFGTLLRRHRRSAGLTQEELAERAGLGVRSISDMERGVPHAPRKDTVLLLAEALALEPEDRSIFAEAAGRLNRPSGPVTMPLTAAPPVFVCYAREDRPFVERLRSDLAARGLAGWEGRDGVRPGTADWEAAVREEIRACQVVLLIASPAARPSRFVKAELAVAEMYGRSIVPLWAAGEQWLDCVPLALSSMQYIDARDLCYPQAIVEIAAILATLVPGIPAIAVALGGSSKDPSGPRPVPPRNPYKGLRAFDREDAGDFFGREDLIGELLAAVGSLGEGPRFLAIVGPSGSGKSSVVMAGLLPRLQAGALPGSAGWIYLPPLAPGAHPLEALTVALGSIMPLSLATIRADLDASERGLHLLAGRVALQPGARVVLVVDQGEELFTLAEDEIEREQFVALLVTAATESRGRVIVLLTLRADFYDRPLAYSALGHLMERHSKAVLPMSLADLRAAIVGPAALPDVGLHFEGDLIGDLLYEVRGQAGALPLLQFTLDQLVARREGRLLTQAAYAELGGVRGALARHAEQTYTLLPSDEHCRLARALFLRLIEPGATEQDTTRRRAPLAELELADGRQTALLRAVVDAFVSARLLTAAESGGAITVEVSHEALIREWQRLAAWLHETRDDVRLQHTLSADAAAWALHGQPADALYRGTVLAEAQAWAGRNTPSAREAAFLAEAEAERARHEAAEHTRQAHELAIARQAAAANRRAATRLRALVGVLVLFLVAAAGLTGIALTNATQARVAQRRALASAQQARMDAQRAYADQQHALASAHQAQVAQQLALANARQAQAAGNLAISGQVAAQAITRMNGQYDLALLLSLEANHLAPTVEARNSLVQGLESAPPGLITFLQGSPLPVDTVAINHNGTLLATGSADGTVRLWDMRSRRPAGPPLDGHGGEVYSIAFSPDGRTLAAGNFDGTVTLWDVAHHRLRGSRYAAQCGCPENAVAFSPDGKMLAAGDWSNTIQLWDVANGSVPPFSPLRDDTIVGTGNHVPAITTLALSPNGKILASATDSSGVIQLWDTTDGAYYSPGPGQTGALRGHIGQVNNIAFSPDGTLLASAGVDGTARLWDVARQRELGSPLPAPTGQMKSVAFSPDGRTLAAGGADGAVVLWDVLNYRPLGAPLVSHTGQVLSLVFKRDGMVLAAATGDGAVALWNTRRRLISSGSTSPATLISGPATDLYIAINPAGTTLAVGMWNGTVQLWNLANQRLRRTLPVGGTVSSVAFSPDGRMLVVGGGAASTIQLWDVASGQALGPPIPTQQEDVFDVVFSPNGKLLAASGGDGSVQLWSVPQRRGGLLSPFGTPLFGSSSNPITNLAFNPSGATLAATGIDPLIYLWDVAHQQQIGSALVGNASSVRAIAYSPNGALLASGGDDGTVRLWDVAQQRPVGGSLVGHTGMVYAVAFSPDGTVLATSGEDRTVRLWDVSSGQPLGTPLTGFEAGVNALAFTSDGKTLVTASYDGSVRLWNVDLQTWPGRACSIANRNLTHQEWRQYLGDLPYRTICPGLPVGT